MISAVADFFRLEINNLSRAADVDWMSDNLYHIVHLDRRKAEKNLRNGYLNVIMKRVGNSRTQQQKSAWIRSNSSDIDDAVRQAYTANYTVTKFENYYVSPNPASMVIAPAGFGWELVFAPGSFTDRATKSAPAGPGNVPFVNRMFASVYADALVDVGRNMPTTSGTSAFRGVTLAEARQNNPRNVTHGLTTAAGRPSGDSMQTTAEVGLAKSMMGLDDSGNYIEDEDFDTRIRRDSVIASFAQDVGHRAATHIIETVKAAVERKLKITDLKDSSLNELNRQHQINLEYADARHNKLMRSRDKDGLLRWVNNLENRLLNNRNLGILTRIFSRTALQLRGSDSMLETATKITPLVAQKSIVEKNIKKKNIKIKKNSRIKTTARTATKKTKNTKTVRVGPKTSSSRKVLKKSSTIPLKVGGGRGRPTKQAQAIGGNVLALKELINKLLPDAILAKMQSPALVNRTGRFRRSAEVTNAMIGPRGGVQIDYTYQREPYEVFEPGSGSPLANQYRDPRRIIGGTVREIAQSIMGKKFVRVRRV